jgi:chromosomal replication initiator protein
MYLMRQFTELSFVEIGRAFGGRDHSTVMYSCAKVTELMEQDKSFSERLNAIVSTLESA